MTSRWARVARGHGAAGFATLIAALSHTVVGGSAPSAFALATTVMIGGAICTLLAGRSLTLWRLVLSVAASQALFHGLFSSLGTPLVAPHAHALELATDAGALHPHTGAMWLAHLAAGLLTIAMIRHAESTVRRLARATRLSFARVLALTAAAPSAIARPVLSTAHRPFTGHASTTVLSGMRHRGPPAVAPAA